VAAAFLSRQPGHLHWPWFVGFSLAVVIVTLVAGAIGVVLLRLKGAYFSIATLGIFIAMPEIINWDLAFGPNGLIPNFFGGGLPLNFPLAEDVTFLGRTFAADHFFFYYLSLGAAVLAVALTLILSRRKFGYSLVAIRENEEAAEVMGINVTRAKVAAYMLSAGLAALGGAVIGYKLTNMTTEAEALFSTTNNLQMIIICLIGGLGTVWGPCVGALFLFSIEELLQTLSGSTGFLQWQAVVFSIVIIGAVLLLPRGLMYFIRNGERVTFKALMRSLVEYRV
jgi:branched-chain amino acid transport system permease protein